MSDKQIIISQEKVIQIQSSQIDLLKQKSQIQDEIIAKLEESNIEFKRLASEMEGLAKQAIGYADFYKKWNNRIF